MAELISAGIDIGTTTTHLVVSRLTFANEALPSRAPNLAIVKREILYESKIYLTPLTATGEIDSKAVAAIVEEAYQAANLEKEKIETGALIITGESARTRNAQAITRELARLAGSFVCESAGPNMESCLAARGSQAVEYSRLMAKTVLNIDIGGGTSNYALIKDGTIIETACLNIGGRCLEFAGANGQPACTVKRSSAAGVKLWQMMGPGLGALTAGQCLDPSEIEALADFMAGEILAAAEGEGSESELLLTPALSPSRWDEIVFSGGVAALMEAAANEENNIYCDMGRHLAYALKKKLQLQGIAYSIAPRAIRATVIGAGMHSLQLSGSTIGFAEEDLPLRNLKLLELQQDMFDDIQGWLSKMAQLKELNLKEEGWAIYLALNESSAQEKNSAHCLTSFPALKKLAEDLADAFSNLQGKQPLVVLCLPDLAMALGMLLKSRCRSMKIITVDSVSAAGDYVDIGLPVSTSEDSNTKSLPVVIKTLVFYKSND